MIAEIKRASPSEGKIASIHCPEKQADDYLKGGAAEISVLTDNNFFEGTVIDLYEVAKSYPQTPVLRKDFLIHSSQIEEAVLAGASAVLLIVALVGNQLKNLLKAADAMGIEALVEVHTEKEIATAIAAGATIIGVNNRCLKSLKVDITTAERLAEFLPNHGTKRNRTNHTGRSGTTRHSNELSCERRC